MPTYIEKEALIKAIKEPSIYDINEPDFISLVNEQPPADVAEVRRGEWIDSEDYKGLRVCSACHDCYVDAEWINKKKWSYCPNCGADMRGKEKENG